MRSCRTCSAPSQGEYCLDHEPKVDEAARLLKNPHRRAYSSKVFAANRQHRFEYARGRCESCGKTVGVGEWDCHHMIAIVDGGSNDMSNLRILCNGPDSCHNRITALDKAERVKRKQRRA